MEAKRVRVITGHRALARFIDDLSTECVGVIPRQTHIPSPYSYSPTEIIYDWHGKKVFIKETAQLRHEVFEVPEGVEIVAAEE